MKTRIVNVKFEVPDTYTDEALHEALCQYVHEGTIDAGKELGSNVIDILFPESSNGQIELFMIQSGTAVFFVRSTKDLVDEWIEVLGQMDQSMLPDNLTYRSILLSDFDEINNCWLS